MRLLTLLAAVVATLALSAGSAAAAQGPDGAATVAEQAAKKQAPAKGRAKRPSCRRGYALRAVRVKRKGKMVRVKRCRKKRAAAKWPPLPALPPKAPASPAPAPAPGAPKPLFDAPGTTLTDAAARAYIERYLSNSRFTDCPAGWPSCSSERRYSHFADGKFFQCLLTPLVGLGIDFVSMSFYETGVVRPDGAWSFNEIVLKSGRPSFYDWAVAADGSVTGFYNAGAGAGVEQIDGLRYAPGARTCAT